MGLFVLRPSPVDVCPRLRAHHRQPAGGALLSLLARSDALREHLLASALPVSPITYPDYMPKGEIRLEDPDGYVLLIGQVG